MDAGDWVTLAAVIVALGIGISSILYTQYLQRKERRERLLNEIIEWATELNKCAFEHEYTKPEGTSLEKYKLLSEVNALARFRVADAKSEYVITIASTFGEALYLNVEQVKKQLDNYINLRWKSIRSKKHEERQKLSKQIQKSEAKIYELARTLIKAAAKFQT